MSTLREIRRRIHSVQSIQQLTRAMEMVAASRLHHAHVKAKEAQPYISKIREILSHLSSISTDFTHPFFQPREIKKIGLVVVSSDTGLCGPYNKDVLSAANKFLQKYDPKQVDLILVGRKAINYYRRRQKPIRHQMLEQGEKLTVMQARHFTDQLINWFLAGELDEIWFVYTHYDSMTSRQVVTKKFLNIEKPAEKPASIEYIFEPSIGEVYSEILVRYCWVFVRTVFNEAYASELAARIFAMKAASTNADDMIKKLTLVRNKVRQAGITKEMIEITSGTKD